MATRPQKCLLGQNIGNIGELQTSPYFMSAI